VLDNSCAGCQNLKKGNIIDAFIVQDERQQLQNNVEMHQERVRSAQTRYASLIERKQGLSHRLNQAMSILSNLEHAPTPYAPLVLQADPVRSSPQTGIFQPTTPPNRPIHSFDHHAAISAAAVLSSEPSLSLDASTLSHNLPAAAQQFKNHVAAQLGQSVDDICWFYQSEHHTSPECEPLSFSIPLISPECTASFFAVFYAHALESALLLEAKSLLEGATYTCAHPSISIPLHLGAYRHMVLPSSCYCLNFPRLKILYVSTACA
jgi:hypothetical protein